MSGQIAVSINPFNGEQLANYPFISKQQWGDKLDKLPLAKCGSQQSSVPLRAEILRDEQATEQGRFQHTGQVLLPLKELLLKKVSQPYLSENSSRRPETFRSAIQWVIRLILAPLHDMIYVMNVISRFINPYRKLSV